MRIIPYTDSRAQKATWILCLMAWCQPVLIGYIITALNKITGIPFDVFYDYVLPGVYILLTIPAITYINQRLRTGDWLFYFGFLAVYLGSYFIARENSEYLGSLLTIIPFVMLPLYFLGVSFELEPIKKQLFIISIVSIIVQILFFRMVIGNQVASYGEVEHDHYLHLSSQVLPYVLYVLWYTFEKPNVFNILFSVVSVLLLLFFGARGPFVSIIFYVVVYLVLFKFPHFGLFSKLLILIGGVLLYWLFITTIAPAMDFISSVGASDRILGWIIGTDYGAQVSSEARVGFAKLAISKLEESNYVGYGFAGDRLFMDGYWVHNFFLECLVSYGIIFGVVIPLVIVIRLVKGVLRDGMSDKCKFLLLLIGWGMIPLLFSGSYVNNTAFYLMLGYCTQVLRTSKQQLRT